MHPGAAVWMGWQGAGLCSARLRGIAAKAERRFARGVFGKGNQTMGENAKQEFARALRGILKSKGMTQQELARQMGCSGATVSDWCSGRKYPRVEKLERMAELLGVALSELTAPRDDLADVDIAFYGEYRALSEADRETVRDMVQVMRARRAARRAQTRDTGPAQPEESAKKR